MFAHRASHRGRSFDDAYSDGMFGLLRAIDRFDLSQKAKFVTYASLSVRGYIGQGIREQSNALGGGHSKLSDSGQRLRSALASVQRSDDPVGEVRKIGKKLRMPIATMAAVLRAQAPIARLDAAITEGGVSFHDVTPSSAQTPEDLVAQKEEREQLSAAVGRALYGLDRREIALIRDRFIAGESSLADLGFRFHVSRERMRQIELRLKTRLRRKLASLRPEAEKQQASGDTAAGDLEYILAVARDERDRSIPMNWRLATLSPTNRRKYAGVVANTAPEQPAAKVIPLVQKPRSRTKACGACGIHGHNRRTCMRRRASGE